MGTKAQKCLDIGAPGKILAGKDLFPGQDIATAPNSRDPVIVATHVIHAVSHLAPVFLRLLGLENPRKILPRILGKQPVLAKDGIRGLPGLPGFGRGVGKIFGLRGLGTRL